MDTFPLSLRFQRHHIIAILCVVMICASWFPSLFIGRLADDFYLYSTKVAAHPFSFLSRGIFPDDAGAKFFRPVPMLLYALETRLEFTPAASHALSIAIHLLNTMLIVVFVLTMVPGVANSAFVFPMVLAALFFGCHPQNAGAVCWLAARFDLLACLFGSVGLLLWMKSYASPRKMLLAAASIAALSAALLSKETAVAFVVAAAAASLVPEWNRGGGRAELALRLSALGAIVIVYLGWRSIVIGGIGGYQNVAWANWVAFVYYGLMDVWPGMSIPLNVSVPTALLIAAAGALVLFSTGRPANDPTPRSLARLLPLLVLLAVLMAFCFTFPMHKYLIMARAESRYSYMQIFVLAILLGIALCRIRAKWAVWACRIAFLAVLLPAIALQREEIDNWKEADRTVRSILDQTKSLVPAPQENPLFVFWGVPLTTKRYCYVFGIGLDEAVARTYGRDDIRVIRYGSQKEQNNPTPDMYRLDYNWDADKMRLIPSWARPKPN